MDTNLDNLIKSALDDAYVKVNNQVPKTKEIQKDSLVSGLTVEEIYNFCKNNNISLNSELFTNDEGDIYISQTVTLSMTDKDIKTFKEKKFENTAWKCVYDSLTSNGYKRIGVVSSFFKKFDGVNLYDRYLNEDFTTLIEYYSCRFVK